MSGQSASERQWVRESTTKPAELLLAIVRHRAPNGSYEDRIEILNLGQDHAFLHDAYVAADFKKGDRGGSVSKAWRPNVPLVLQSGEHATVVQLRDIEEAIEGRQQLEKRPILDLLLSIVGETQSTKLSPTMAFIGGLRETGLDLTFHEQQDPTRGFAHLRDMIDTRRKDDK